MFFAQRDFLAMVKWSPHRHVLGAIGASGHFSVYDPMQAQRLRWYGESGDPKHADLLCLSWSPTLASRQAELVALGGYAGVVEVWNLRTAHKVCVYTGHSPEVSELPASLPPNRRAITALAWSDDGNFIASAGEDMRVHIWHPTSGELCAVADREPLRAGYLLAWLSTRTLLSSNMNRVYIWDALTGRVFREIETSLPWEKPNSYALSPNRQHLAIATDSSVLIYNLRTGKREEHRPPAYQPHSSSYRYTPSLVAWNPDGYRLAICFADEPNRILLWSMRGKRMWQIHEQFADVTCLDWSADGGTLAWGGDGFVATAAFPDPANPPPINPHTSSDVSSALVGVARPDLIPPHF